jgi:hypothetical protein
MRMDRRRELDGRPGRFDVLGALQLRRFVGRQNARAPV